MSVALAVFEGHEQIASDALDDLSLQELAVFVNEEHEAVAAAVTFALVHAVRLGQALNIAFLRMPRGEWRAWVEANCGFSVTTATLYRRIGFHGDELRRNGVRSVKQARRYVKNEGLKLPWVGGHHSVDPDRKRAARQMRKEGASYDQIAEALAADGRRVWEWCNPEAVKKKVQQRTKERGELRRLRREKAMRVAGGATYEGYALMRKAAITLQTAMERERDRDARKALSNAIAKLHQAEDEMYRAVKLTNEDRS